MPKQLSGHCPCCQAPLPPAQDESQITCAHCGAQIILKLPLDQRIEKIAIERAVFLWSPQELVLETIPCLLFYGWPIWRFWLRDSGYLENPLILYGLIVLAIVLWTLYAIKLIRFVHEMENLAESCDWSVTRLRQLVKAQPTFSRKSLLWRVEKNIKEINRQLDM